MSEWNNKRFYYLPLLLTTTLVACGGGGGDDGGLTYNGNSSQAHIDETNAKELTLNSYGESKTGSVLGAPLSPVLTQASLADSAGSPKSKLQDVLDVSAVAFSVAVNTNELRPFYGNRYEMSAAAMDSGTMRGSCGGSVSYRMDANESTGKFTGSFNYSNYCDEGVRLNGSMSMSGSVDETQGFHIELRFDALQAVGDGESSTMDGTMSMTMTDSRTELTMNLLARDDSSGEIYKIENLMMTEIEQAGYSESTIIGRFYDPVEGYVDITTPLPFKIYSMSYYPTEGKMRIEGADSTFATLTANSDGYTCLVEADTNGDGTIDYSETVSWEQEL